MTYRLPFDPIKGSPQNTTTRWQCGCGDCGGEELRQVEHESSCGGPVNPAQVKEQSGLGFDYARLDGGRFLVAEIGNYLVGIYRPKSCGLQQAHGGFSLERCGNAIVTI